jgi:hypothetical protein
LLDLPFSFTWCSRILKQTQGSALTSLRKLSKREKSTYRYEFFWGPRVMSPYVDPRLGLRGPGMTHEKMLYLRFAILMQFAIRFRSHASEL